MDDRLQSIHDELFAAASNAGVNEELPNKIYDNVIELSRGANVQLNIKTGFALKEDGTTLSDTAEIDSIKNFSSEGKSIKLQNIPNNATSVTFIGKFQDIVEPEIGKITQAIVPIHLAIRSNLPLILNGETNPSLFDIPDAKPFDPKHIQQATKSAQRILAVAKGVKDAQLYPEDIQNLSDAIKDSARALNAISIAYEGHPDKQNGVKSLSNDVASYGNEYHSYLIANLKKKKPSATAGSSSVKAAGIDIGESPTTETFTPFQSELLDQLTAKVEEDLAQKARAQFASSAEGQSAATAKAEIENIRKLIDALQQGFNAPLTNNTNTAIGNGSLDWLANTLNIESVEKGQAVFADNDGKYKFVATPDRIEHQDTDGTLSLEEAIKWNIIAAQNPKMLANGIKFTGSDEDKAILKVANDIVRKTMNVPKILNLAEIPDAAVTAAQHRANAFLEFRRDNDGKVDYSAMPKPYIHNNGSQQSALRPSGLRTAP